MNDHRASRWDGNAAVRRLSKRTRTRWNLAFLFWAVLTGFDPAANPLWPFDMVRATVQLIERENQWNRMHP